MTMEAYSYKYSDKARISGQEESSSSVGKNLGASTVVALNPEPTQGMVSKVASAAGTIILSPILVPYKIVSFVGRAVSTQKPQEEKPKEDLSNDWEVVPKEDKHVDKHVLYFTGSRI